MPTPNHCTRHTVVLGCGNVLYGDDGFGPAVAEHLLRAGPIPDHALVLNLGLATRGVVFDILLSERRPQRLVVVDAVDRPGRRPGEVFDLPLDELPREKVDDFSFHQGPTSNLLRELRDHCGVEVAVVACQPRSIPGEMAQGLSAPVRGAVARASRLIRERYLGHPAWA